MESPDEEDLKTLQKFGSLVRVARLRKKLSQESLADLAGLDRTYIGGVERGERNISLINIIKISRALDIKPAIMFEDLQ